MRAADDDRIVEAAAAEGDGAVRDEDGAAEGATAGDEPAFDVVSPNPDAPDSDALAVQAEASKSPAPAPAPEPDPESA